MVYNPRMIPLGVPGGFETLVGCNDRICCWGTSELNGDSDGSNGKKNIYMIIIHNYGNYGYVTLNIYIYINKDR